MAWWQFWRTQEASDSSSVPRASGPVIARTSAPEAAEGGVARQSSAGSAASAGGPPAWQLLPPPALHADRPMALTFDHAIQRSLAAHAAPESLTAAARPLRHEIRTDAPMGVKIGRAHV